MERIKLGREVKYNSDSLNNGLLQFFHGELEADSFQLNYQNVLSISKQTDHHIILTTVKYNGEIILRNL